MRTAAGLVFAVSLAAAPAPATAVAGTPIVHQFSTGITAGSVPTRIAAGPDGNLWFVENGGDRIGRITPSGVVTEFTNAITGTGLFGITAGPDGNLWFTEAGSARIGRITPSGVVAEFAAGITPASAPEAITAGADGNLWFTENNLDQIGSITPAGAVSEYSAGITGHPSGITAGPDGDVWFTEPDADTIGSITPLGGIIEYSAGITPGSHPSGITAGPDGNLWFTEPNNGDRIGRITPSGVVTEFSSGLTVGSNPFAITAGPDGNLWFTESGVAGVGRITPSGVITEFSSAISPGSKPTGITAGPDGALWFAESQTPAIARITTGVDPPRYTDPARIEVPANGTTQGPASPYPATIDAEDLPGTVTKVTVRLNDIVHAAASDIQAELVAPDGTAVLIDANSTVRLGDGSTPPQVLAGPTVTFADGAPAAGRYLTTGIFAPITPGFALNFTAPAPTTPATTLTAFNGHTPNGVWSLYVVDGQGAPGSTGEIAGGWSLDIQTTGPAPVQIPGPTTTTTITAAAPPPPPPDTTKPTLLVTRLVTKTVLKAFRGGVSLRVTPSEPVTLDVTLGAPVHTVTIAAAGTPLVLAQQTLTLKTRAAKTLTLKPSAKLLGHPRHTFKAVLRIVATDLAGNRTTTTRTITVAPDPVKHRRRR